ncbi:unnamed protein product [Paramecium octaurelia]|uniref:Uncharacterized protein n=1 Tax=Paramecium octaurelia TaxID=43137 RepID=A0A8S1TR92_PAROT|nr:unnamed protein product [Paramecium octaurelia]
MCLPTDYLEFIVNIEQILILMGGMGSLGYTINLQVNSDIAIEDEEYSYGYGKGVLVAFWIISSSMALNGVIGNFARKNKLGCLILNFNLINIALFTWIYWSYDYRICVGKWHQKYRLGQLLFKQSFFITNLGIRVESFMFILMSMLQIIQVILQILIQFTTLCFFKGNNFENQTIVSTS